MNPQRTLLIAAPLLLAGYGVVRYVGRKGRRGRGPRNRTTQIPAGPAARKAG